MICNILLCRLWKVNMCSFQYLVRLFSSCCPIIPLWASKTWVNTVSLEGGGGEISHLKCNIFHTWIPIWTASPLRLTTSPTRQSSTFHRSTHNLWFTSTCIRSNVQQHVSRPPCLMLLLSARTSVNESRSTRTTLLHAILPDLLQNPPKARSVTVHSFVGRRSETMLNARTVLEYVIKASRGFWPHLSASGAGFNSWRGENWAQEER